MRSRQIDAHPGKIHLNHDILSLLRKRPRLILAAAMMVAILAAMAAVFGAPTTSMALSSASSVDASPAPLPETLSKAEMQIQGPSSPYLKITRVQEEVEYEPVSAPDQTEATPPGSSSDLSPTANQPPQFKASNFAFNLRENRGRGWQSPRGKLTATDPDGPSEVITYAITGGNPVCSGCGMPGNPYRDNLFRIAKNARITYQGSGEDYEAFPVGKARYDLAVTASDQHGATADARVLIVLVDRPEPPMAPVAPNLSTASRESLTASWTEPANTGPTITDYKLRYRIAGSSSAWKALNLTGTTLTASIAGLKPGTAYEAQVRARNDEGTGPWSATGSGNTTANAAPVIAGPDTVTLELEEGSPSGTNFGSAFTATDTEGDGISWSLGGTHPSFFNISNGQVSVSDSLHYAEGSTFMIQVVAADQYGAQDTVNVTVNITSS